MVISPLLFIDIKQEVCLEDGKEQLILNPESHFQSVRLSPKSVQPLLSDSDNELVCFTFTQQSSYADFKLLFVTLQIEKNFCLS